MPEEVAQHREGSSFIIGGSVFLVVALDIQGRWLGEYEINTLEIAQR